MRWLHFAFVGGSFPQSPSRFSSARHLHNLQAPDVLNLNVGGVKYSLAHDDIVKFPTSAFQQLAEDAGPNNECIPMDRDGGTFKYVHAFMVNGQLPRDKIGQHALDKSTLRQLRKEARYFSLDALTEECYVESSVPEKYYDAYDRKRERDFIENVKIYEPIEPLNYTRGENSSLEQALRQAWTPACSIDTYYVFPNVGMSSKEEKKPTVKEFLDRIYERFQPINDTNTLEIETDHVRDILQEMFCKSGESVDQLGFRLGLTDDEGLRTRLRRVDIHTAGARITNRACHEADHDETHVGTVVGIVTDTPDSWDDGRKLSFTGGEMRVKYGGNTFRVTPSVVSTAAGSSEPAFYLTMHRNCTYSMSPVKSGTRVSLVYDIYRTTNDTSLASKYEVPLRTDSLNYPIMMIAPERKQRVFDELDRALSEYDSVTVGLLDSYLAEGTLPKELEPKDRLLYDMLSEKYDVEIVAATVYTRTHCETCEIIAGFYSEEIIDRVISNRPKKSKRKSKLADLLVVPHWFAWNDKLDSNSYHVDRYEEFDYDELHLVSGLRVKNRCGA